jgi:hypothetical protein
MDHEHFERARAIKSKMSQKCRAVKSKMSQRSRAVKSFTCPSVYSFQSLYIYCCTLKEKIEVRNVYFFMEALLLLFFFFFLSAVWLKASSNLFKLIKLVVHDESKRMSHGLLAHDLAELKQAFCKLRPCFG